MNGNPAVSEAPRYLDGFLAAVRPTQNRAAGPPPPPSPPATPAPPAAPVLSRQEQVKRDLHPLDSFARLVDCAENDGPPASDDCFRFEWFGLFYQAPCQDAFLLRLRLPGGRLEAFQLAALADIVQELAGGHVVLNAQGGLDVPGVPVRAAVEILRRTEGIGLSARQSGGDCVQAVRGGNEAFDRLIGVLELALRHRRDLADLPQGCEIVFCTEGDEPDGIVPAVEANTLVVRAVPAAPDAAFLLVVPGVAEGGFLLPPGRVVPGCLRLLETWAAGGDRTDRPRAGLAGFCRLLGCTRIAALLGDARWQTQETPRRVTPGSPGLPVPDGRLLSGQLLRIGKMMQEHGLTGIRLSNGRLHVARAMDDAPRAMDDALRAILGQT